MSPTPRFLFGNITLERRPQQPLIFAFDLADAETQLALRCRRDHPLWVTYRRYRRGKNRCKLCGCKIGGRA